MTDLPSVDDVLGAPPKPSVDDLLGPEDPAAPVTWSLQRRGQVQRYFARPEGKMAVDRVLDAFGVGASHMIGDRLGLDTETRAALQDVGFLNKEGESVLHKTFNNLVLNPAAALFDVANGALGGFGAAYSQVLSETGLLARAPDPAAAAEQFSTLAMVAAGGEAPLRAPEMATVPRKASLLDRAQDAGVLKSDQPKVDASIPRGGSGRLSENATGAVSGFTTSKGSTYVYQGAGTARNKKATGESFSASDATVFVDPQVAQNLLQEIGAAQVAGQGKIVGFGPDGRIGLITRSPEGSYAKGTFEEIPHSTTPEIGKAVIEVWKKDVQGNYQYHIGHEVTDIARDVAAPRKAPLLDRAQDAGVLKSDQPKVDATAPISSAPEKVDPGEVMPAPGSAAKDTAGNINLKNLNTPDDIKDVIRETANSRVIAFGESSPFIDARRGVQTHAGTRELAQLVGMTPETLAKRRKGEAFNAETALASRNLLIQSAQNVKELASKARSSDQALLEFEEAVTRHVAIQEQVAGMTAEAGRALQQFRIKAGEAIDVKAMLDKAGGRDKIEAMAEALATMTPEEASAALPNMRKATTMDMIREAWINGLLSAPTTHQANMIGNLLTSIWRVPEQYAAAAAGLLHGGEKVSFREANATAFGLIQGARDGLVAAWTALKSGEAPDALSKLEQTKYRAIPGTAGELVRTPSRLLMVEDEFFKAMNTRAAINELAVRQAKKEGLDGKALLDRVADLKANPTDKMLTKAHDMALYYSFQSELGEVGKMVMRIRDKVPGLSFIAPFIRTPANIMKYAAARSPLAGLTWFFEGSPVGQALRGEHGAAARDIAMTRVAIGTGVGIAVTSLAAEGLLTGSGPQDARQRALLYASGWLPYAVKIGDKWHGYNRYDPFGLLVGVWTDLYELKGAVGEEEADKIAAMTVASVSNALINKTWLSGPAQLMAALNDPERYGDQYVRQLAGSVVPGVVGQTARAIDPVARDARTITDQLKTRVPWLSQTVMPKRDIFGEVIQREGDAFTVGSVATIQQDPVVEALLALGVYPAKLDRVIRGVDLTAAQYDEFQMVAGRLMKASLQELVTSPAWPKMHIFERQKLVSGLVDGSREQARAYMLLKDNGALLEKAVAAAEAEMSR